MSTTRRLAVVVLLSLTSVACGDPVTPTGDPPLVNPGAAVLGDTQCWACFQDNCPTLPVCRLDPTCAPWVTCMESCALDGYDCSELCFELAPPEGDPGREMF